MKIKTLGYVFSVQKQLPTPEQVEIASMEEKERDCQINITAQINQIKFLENIYERYAELELEEKMDQTNMSLEAAQNTLTQWEVQLETIEQWYENQG
jgi:hypothetical protein